MINKIIPSAIFVCIASPTTANEIDDWAKTVGRRVERVLEQRSGEDAGLVVVTMRRDASGRPQILGFSSADENGRLERGFRKSLARLRRLPPLQLGVSSEKMIAVKDLFGAGDSPEGIFEHNRTYRQLVVPAATSNAKRNQTMLASH